MPYPPKVIRDQKTVIERYTEPVGDPNISPIERVNQVVKMWTDPCDVGWIVYIETLWPAALRLLVNVLMFGILDLVRAYFRPVRSRGRGHGRRGAKDKPKKRRGGDVPERIARNLPGYDDVAGRKVTDGVRVMWRIDGVIQRFLWYWLVIDVTTQFFHDWSTLIYETQQCQLAGRGRGLRTQGHEDVISGGGVWQSVNPDVRQYAKDGVTFSSFGFAFPPGRWSISGNVTYRNTGIDTGKFQFRLVVVANGVTYRDEGAWQEVTPGDVADAIGHMEVEGQGQCLMEVRRDGSTWAGEEADLHIMQAKEPL